MAQVIGKNRSEKLNGTPEEAFKVTGIKNAQVHDVLLSILTHQTQITIWEIQLDEEQRRLPAPTPAPLT